MKWNESKRNAAQESEESRNGCWCIFVPLSDTEGVKFYHRPEVRDAAMEHQKRAHSLGFGPAVGETCEMPMLETWPKPECWNVRPTKVYGYVTELAEGVGEWDGEAFDFLCEVMQEYGESTVDLHEGNMGWINGYPVCIDFDPGFYGRDEALLDEGRAARNA